MQENIQLKDYTTMKIGGPARFFTTVHTKEELETLLQNNELPVLVLGQGSNVIVGDKGFDGLVILNRITGFEIFEQNPSSAKIRIGAGELWDSVVEKSVENGLSGIECLSAIPGYTGAAPVQNIGAYGQEIADTLLELEAFDLHSKSFVTFTNSDCDFKYRQSVFNTGMNRGRYIITSIVLELTKTVLEPPFYSSLQGYLDSHQISDYNPYNIRQAVVTIRSTKLPDPSVIPNTGSFFKNPIVEKWQAQSMLSEYPDLKVFPMGENLSKLAAGWLIEHAELKGLEMNGFKIYDNNALVITNPAGSGTYEGLLEMRDHIISTVRDTFRITLEQEPEEIGV